MTRRTRTARATAKSPSRARRTSAIRADAAPNDVEAIARHLAGSLESTRRGLETFLGSLESSGMPEALQGYRHLHAVLTQQRLWASGHGRGELDPLFASVAAVAIRIREVLGPYAEVMERIGEVDRISAAPEPPQPARRGKRRTTTDTTKKTG